MKYLIFTLLFLLNCSILSAQDTLFVKGKRKPLLVNITIVKKNSLNYTKEKGGLVYTVKMKNVKKIKFQKISEVAPPIRSQSGRSSTRKVKTYADFDEFRSTISANSIGTIRYYAGLNYLFHLRNINSQSKRHNYFVNVGGGFYNRGRALSLGTLDFIDRTQGSYLEFGLRMEIESRRNPSNRFHLGLDANNKWVEQTISRFNSPTPEVSNITQFVIQVPIGYTYRSPNGFYLNTGLEVTTEKLFPAFHVGLGVAFGR